MAFLLDDRGLVLTLMKAGRNVEVKYPGFFHIGFFIESEAKVDEIHAKLVAAGFEVAALERAHAYSFYVNAPGGFMIEIGA